MHEIVDWIGYTEAQRSAVIRRISALVEQVASPLIEITDKDLLCQALTYQQVRFDKNAGPYVWVLELLKLGAGSLIQLEPFGCRVRFEYASLSLVEVREQIDRDFFTLSQVHFERYFTSQNQTK